MTASTSMYFHDRAERTAAGGTAAPAQVQLCDKCGANNLRPSPRRSLADRLMIGLFSVFPHRCHSCRLIRKRFRLSWRVFVLPAAALVLGAGTWYVASHRVSSSRENPDQNQADLLARTRLSAGGQLSAYEQMMVHRPKQTLTNDIVLKLCNAHMGREVILQLIRNSSADYDITADALIRLKQAGVDETIIMAMVDNAYRNS